MNSGDIRQELKTLKTANINLRYCSYFLTVGNKDNTIGVEGLVMNDIRGISVQFGYLNMQHLNILEKSHSSLFGAEKNLFQQHICTYSAVRVFLNINSGKVRAPQHLINIRVQMCAARRSAAEHAQLDIHGEEGRGWERGRGKT
jgi:hypothetical protein